MGVWWADWKSNKSSFWSVVFSYSTQHQYTIYWSHCDMRWKTGFLWQLTTTSSGVGPRISKALPQTKFAPPQKKVTVTVWWSAAHLIHYSFLNPDKTITAEKYAQQISEIHQKLQRLQPALVNRKSPILLHGSTQLTSHNQRFKSWSNWGKIFCPILHIHLTSHQPTTTSPSVLTTFCEENTSMKSKR